MVTNKILIYKLNDNVGMISLVVTLKEVVILQLLLFNFTQR